MSVFSDFCRVAACAVALQTREEEYFEVVKRYTRDELDGFVEAFAMLTNEMQQRPFEDCLGPFYTEIASKSTRDVRGEFYTPPAVSELMTRMLMDVEQVIAEGKPITVGEPACGSGGMILALAKQFSPLVRDDNKSYVDLLRVTLQDVSPTSADMAYVNMTQWGIPAKVILGDTLRGTVDQVWRNWHWARVGETQKERWQMMFRVLDDLMQPESEHQESREHTPMEPPQDFSQMDFQF
ncbi:MAG: N-6 DNA methylase [Akkermansiaceae bacterium]